MAETKVLIDLNAAKKSQRHYETIFILSPALTDAVVKETTDKNVKLASDLGATVLRQDDWGKRRMAYSIERHAMGRYIFLRYIGTEECVRAIERSLKLDANVLRFQSVRLSDPLSADEIRDLVERAPREASSAPSVRGEDDEPALESSY